jgi:hypothetical protein
VYTREAPSKEAFLLRLLSRIPTTILFAAGLSLAACGGDGNDDPTGAGGGDTSQGGSSAAGSGATSSGGSGPTVEDCTNGADDDDDGTIDCGDADCGDYQCIAVPEGWLGPVVLQLVGDGAPLSDCPPQASEIVAEGHVGLLDAYHSCSPCACDGTEVGCSAVTVQAMGYYGSGSCPTSCGSVTFSDGECKPWTPSLTDTCASGIHAPTQNVAPLGGSCAVSGGEAMLQPAGWQSSARACAPPSTAGGCTPGAACHPKTAPEGYSPTCVMKSGDQVCPAGYPNRQVLNGEVTDTRGCEACSCEAPVCTVYFGGFDGDGCTGTEHLYAWSPACQWIPQKKSLRYNPFADCVPSGGQIKGSVEAQGPVTFCCQE